MKRLSVLIIVFSIMFTVLFFAPPLLSSQFAVYPLMKIGDVFDILTPLILLPLYWLLFRVDADRPPGSAESLVFFVLAAFWVEGQGMHLAANSIGHLVEDMTGSNVYSLTNFYDEVLSHYLWHFGIVGLSFLIMYRQWKNSFKVDQAAPWLPITAGIIHGFTLFVAIVEGGTAPLGVPSVVLGALLGLVWGRNKFNRRPLVLFFLVACLVAVVLFAGWGAYWHGLPEFSKVGIID